MEVIGPRPPGALVDSALYAHLLTERLSRGGMLRAVDEPAILLPVGESCFGVIPAAAWLSQSPLDTRWEPIGRGVAYLTDRRVALRLTSRWVDLPLADLLAVSSDGSHLFLDVGSSEHVAVGVPFADYWHVVLRALSSRAASSRFQVQGSTTASGTASGRLSHPAGPNENVPPRGSS